MGAMTGSARRANPIPPWAGRPASCCRRARSGFRWGSTGEAGTGGLMGLRRATARAAAMLAAGLLLLAGCSREQPQEVEPPRPGPIEEVVVTAPPPDAGRPGPEPLPPLCRDIEKRTFQFFWDTTDERNGMTPDRFPSRPFASVAAIGFALTAYPIGIENGWISRRQAVDRTLL